MEGVTYIRQGGHDVGHWPTFLVVLELLCDIACAYTAFHFKVTHATFRQDVPAIDRDKHVASTVSFITIVQLLAAIYIQKSV